MRLVALVLLSATLAACGDAGTAERLSSKETLDGIDVPTIGTVGDFPDPAHRTVVNVTVEGRVVIDGETIASERLFEQIRLRGGRTPGSVVPGTRPPLRMSDESIVIRADGALPWGAAWRLIQLCAEAHVWRLSFAVGSEDGGPEGCIGLPLPEDRPSEDPPPRLARYEVIVRPGVGGSPAALFAAIAQRPTTDTGKRVVSLDVDPRLPLRVALESIDAVHRVGAVEINLIFGPDLRRPLSKFQLAEEVSDLRLASSAYSIGIVGKGDVDPHAARPFLPKTRVRGPAEVRYYPLRRVVEVDELGDPIPPKPPK